MKLSSRVVLTEPEVRYYFDQIAAGISDIHIERNYSQDWGLRPLHPKLIVFYRNASQEKGLECAPIFKGRTRSIPRSIWQTLTVRTEGQELDSMLEYWGASDIRSNPVITAPETPPVVSQEAGLSLRLARTILSRHQKSGRRSTRTSASGSSWTGRPSTSTTRAPEIRQLNSRVRLQGPDVGIIRETPLQGRGRAPGYQLN